MRSALAIPSSAPSKLTSSPSWFAIEKLPGKRVSCAGKWPGIMAKFSLAPRYPGIVNQSFPRPEATLIEEISCRAAAFLLLGLPMS